MVVINFATLCFGEDDVGTASGVMKRAFPKLERARWECSSSLRQIVEGPNKCIFGAAVARMVDGPLHQLKGKSSGELPVSTRRTPWIEAMQSWDDRERANSERGCHAIPVHPI